MAKGFVHVNGVTYELHGNFPDGGLTNEAEQLRSGAGTVFTRPVIIEGQQAVPLSIRLDQVWASATWTEPEVDSAGKTR